MVERMETGLAAEFVGVVRDVVFETGIQRQYHITISPVDIKVSGPTGVMHEWVGLSPKADEEKIPVGSVLDRYMQMLENCIPAAEKAKTVAEAFGMMKGKKFRFKRMKLGRDYEGNKAKEYLTPVALVA